MFEFVILIIILILAATQLFLLWFKKPDQRLYLELQETTTYLQRLQLHIEQLEKTLKDEFQRGRLEHHALAKTSRDELAGAFTAFKQDIEKNIEKLNLHLRQQFGDFAQLQTQAQQQTLTQMKEIRSTVETHLQNIRTDNSKQLDEMRKTVDEKLQKTLNDRLSQSFETVGKQLQAVQTGLGEMKNLASDVGGLKRVLSNVKMRGSIGEVQLAMLLEQVLAPDQYAANVKTKQHSGDLVEFAVKLPGRQETTSHVWLPIDAKFPKDIYEQLQLAYDDGDPQKIADGQRLLETTIKKMAKDIGDKYIDPPNTTDFGIMFLPFEGIYAEVVRKAALLEDLQRNYKVMVTGPTTLAAILSSLQMGFKTLAIQKRSGEVWEILGAVKKEFDLFGNLISKAQKQIQSGLDDLDDVVGKRTRAIQRKLKSVESSDHTEKKAIFASGDDASSSTEDA